MSKQVKRVGFATLAIGVLDWFARYQTGKDIIAAVTTHKMAELASVWWVSPLILIIGFLILYGDRLLADHNHETEMQRPLINNESRVSDSGNATASATGGNVYIGYPPPLQTSENKKEPSKTRRPLIERSKPKLISASLDDHQIWRQAITAPAIRAVVVPFYYNPRSELRDQLYIRAHLVMADTDSDRRVNVSAACWIDEELDHVTLRPGDEKFVLLLAFRDDGKPVTCWNATEQLDLSVKADIRMRELTTADKNVEITLFWDDDQNCETYRFQLTNINGLLQFRLP